MFSTHTDKRIIPSAGKRRRARTGFSLIEINIALMIVAVGVLALFSLFPQGMKLGSDAKDDSMQAIFAERVLSMIEGNAMSITEPGNFTPQNLVQDTGLRYALDHSQNETGYYYDVPEDRTLGSAPNQLERLKDASRFALYRLVITETDTSKNSTAIKAYHVQLFCTFNLSGKRQETLESVMGYYTKVTYMGL